ncbi:MAG: hypothetical protein RI908_231, partial [Actinomycetota bacterium]
MKLLEERLRPFADLFENWPQRYAARCELVRIVPGHSIRVDAFDDAEFCEKPKSGGKDVRRNMLG